MFCDVVYHGREGRRCAVCWMNGTTDRWQCARASGQDLDVENCMFTIIDQLLDRLDLQPPMPSELREVLRRCAQDRLRVMTLSGARPQQRRTPLRFLWPGWRL